MTATQNKMIREFRATFDGDSVDVVDQSDVNGKVHVFVSRVTTDCKTRLHNHFVVGPRGGMVIVKREFLAT